MVFKYLTLPPLFILRISNSFSNSQSHSKFHCYNSQFPCILNPSSNICWTSYPKTWFIVPYKLLWLWWFMIWLVCRYKAKCNNYLINTIIIINVFSNILISNSVAIISIQDIPNVFCAGLDLKEVIQSDKDRLVIFRRTFQKMWSSLYGSSLVTMAAIKVWSVTP